MGPKGSLLLSQNSTTCPYPEPHPSCPRHTKLFLHDPF